MRSRRRWLHLPHDHGEPLSQPRYDLVAGVLAVFLGMFVWIDVPPQTHATVFDLPSAYFDLPLYEPDTSAAYRAQPVVRVGLNEDGTPMLDGKATNYRDLEARLREGLYEPIEPVVVFDPHADTAYGDTALLLAVIGGTGITKFCFAALREHSLSANEIRDGNSNSTWNEIRQRRDARVAQEHDELVLCDEELR